VRVIKARKPRPRIHSDRSPQCTRRNLGTITIRVAQRAEQARHVTRRARALYRNDMYKRNRPIYPGAEEK